MTLLVTSIIADNLGQVRAWARRAWAGGAEAVELRIDTYADDPAALADYLAGEKDRKWIVTCRGMAEGGRCAADAHRRASLLAEATRNTHAYIDFELADWRVLADRPLSESPSRLILSAHDLETLPADLPAIVDEATAERHDAIVKVAYRAADICDGFAALDLMRDCGRRVIGVAMGEEGVWSRVLARKLGAFATYSCLTADSATAPGQLTLADMLETYRWRDINASTQVFGVIGDPVAHSMSPMLFNRWFADAQVNAVYLPLRVAAADDCLERFLSACVARPWLDVGGLSVTLPHKTGALRWVGDGADHLASRTGAVNTLVFGDAKATGYNTDCYAALASVTDALGCSCEDLFSARVDVLGTGGAARAVLAWLNDYGCAATVYGRSADKTAQLTRAFAATPAAWNDRAKRAGEILINCTNVGMWPDVDSSPMPTEALGGCRLVFDLIYNPLETRLLTDAAATGAKTLNGLDMFIRQAAAQFQLWTSTVPDRRRARDLIIREIRRRTGGQA